MEWLEGWEEYLREMPDDRQLLAVFKTTAAEVMRRGYDPVYEMVLGYDPVVRRGVAVEEAAEAAVDPEAEAVEAEWEAQEAAEAAEVDAIEAAERAEELRYTLPF